MNILAINTTNKLAEVACCANNKVSTSKMDSSFSEHIIPAIQTALSNCNAQLNQIDCFGIVTGPGSFTGIRIGLSVLKGMLCALNKKCVAVNSFELVAYNIQESNFIVLLDSGNSEPYYAIFKNGICERYGFSDMQNIGSFAAINKLNVFCSMAEKQAFENFDYVNVVEINPNTFCNLIAQKAHNNNFVQINQISPIYIKQSQAEIGLEQDIKQNVFYRAATLSDIDALAVIDEQCFEASEKYSKQTFAEELSLADRHYIVAVHKNLVVGYVGLWKTGDDLNLLKIAILPQFRQLGLGFCLMQQTFDYRKDNNCDKYFLEVRESNSKAIKLYQKFGFKTMNIRKKYYDDGENCLVMFAD